MQSNRGLQASFRDLQVAEDHNLGRAQMSDCLKDAIHVTLSALVTKIPVLLQTVKSGNICTS